MFRRYEFEKQADEDLQLMPMTVRRKLDLLGLKLHLEQWQALSRIERLVTCHFPVELTDEREVLAQYLREAVQRRGAGELTPLDARAGEAPPGAKRIPADAARLIAQLKLPESEWEKFDADERFALARLARQGAETFAAAWQEMISRGRA
jgi:hypothetical protein